MPLRTVCRKPALQIGKITISSALVLVNLFNPLLMTSAQGQTPPVRESQRSNSNVIQLLLAASKAENPQRAIELLQAAREELKKERLSPEDTARILAMIEELEKKVRSRMTGNVAKILVAPADTKRLSAIEGPPASAAKAPGEAPLPPVVNLNSMTAPTNDSAKNASNESSEKSGPVPGAQASAKEPLDVEDVEKTLASNPEVRDALWEIGRSRLSRDSQNLDAIVHERTGKTAVEIDTQAAKDLAEAEKPGAFLELLDRLNIMNIDVSKANQQLKQEFDGIALDVLADQLIRSASLYSLPAGAVQGVLIDKGFLGKVAGMSAESLATFLINAKLVLRLADLYGIEMDDTEKRVVMLVVFTAAKVGGRVGMNSPGLSSSMGSFGEMLGRLKFSGKSGQVVAWLKNWFTNRAVASVAAPVLAGAPGLADDTTKTPAAQPVKKVGALKSLASRVNFGVLARIAMHSGISVGETQLVGWAAKTIFSGERKAKRAVHGENFRRFLMTSTGEGFLKLLVLTMNDGRPSVAGKRSLNRISRNSEMKTKMDFIFNIARSARSCSDEDLVKASTDKLANYSCSNNPNTARFERLKAEMLTFDEIPQDYVADLRIVSREQRLRMAELILQMQFLDGDRNPNETQFFRDVIVKTLGVDRVPDLEYFERLHSFIQESGGLEVAPESPTGYSVRADARKSPYDMNRGYLPLQAPEPPVGPRYLNSSRSKASKADDSTDRERSAR